MIRFFAGFGLSIIGLYTVLNGDDIGFKEILGFTTFAFGVLFMERGLYE